VAEDERVRRPALERTEPIRSFWTLFGAAAAAAPGGPAGREAPGEPRDGPVKRGVELGYRVIEEYLRQGRSFAQTLGGTGAGRAAFGPAAFGSPGTGGDFQALSERMLRSYADFASLWLELMSAMATDASARAAASGQPETPTDRPGAASETPVPGFPQAPPESAGPEPGGARVSIEIDCERPAEVSVDLQPQPAGRALRILDLRAADADLSRLRDVGIQGATADEPVRIRIRVPRGQPPGTYTGVILDDESSVPRGTLCLRIGPRPAEGPAS
jgi:hypothetical protein